jgi:hypothetical protein
MDSPNANIRHQQMSAVQKEAFELFKRKNADYGDAFAKYGTVGVIMRMGDKIQRLVSISKTGINLIETETLRDTLIDLHNYAAMAVMLLDETEPDIKDKQVIKEKQEIKEKKMDIIDYII